MFGLGVFVNVLGVLLTYTRTSNFVFCGLLCVYLYLYMDVPHVLNLSLFFYVCAFYSILLVCFAMMAVICLYIF